MPDFSRFDNSDRAPRPVQIRALRELNDNWDKTDVHALILPVGSGKSAIARSLQVAEGADVLTISNSLVSQYSGDYPQVNFLKGKQHYQCKSGLSCKDWQECGFEPCEGCPYQEAKSRAISGGSTFYNPMSFYYFTLSSGFKGNRVQVVDEAHQLPSMVSMLCGRRLRRSDYNFSEKCINERYFVQWLANQIARLAKLSDMYFARNETEKLGKTKDEISSLSLLKSGIEENPENYVLWIDKEGREEFLNIKPIFPPRFLMDRIVGGKKLILMSGTLFDHDIRMICGDQPYTSIEQASPIPKENRTIHWKPAPFAVNYQTDPKAFAEYIMQFVEKGKNTLIHTTYALSRRLAPYMPKDVIINDQENKEEKIEEFKRNGGIFLASGCAEGIDFKYDLCHINIESQLSWPNLADPVVKKRKAMQDGNLWFSLETLKTSMQRHGRSTRAVDDKSTIIVCDPNYRRLVESNKRHLPKSYYDSINWG